MALPLTTAPLCAPLRALSLAGLAAEPSHLRQRELHVRATARVGGRVRIDRVLIGLLMAVGDTACGNPAGPADGPAVVTIVSGDGQEAVTANGSQTFTGNGGPPDSLRVRVTNSAGDPVQGALVTWMTRAGSVSPSTSLTDSAGMASARWSWYAPQAGYVAPGVYTATAFLAGVDSATFTGYARVGVALRDLRISPDTVTVSSGPSTVIVTLRATDDRTAFGLDYTSVTFASPPGAPPTGWLQALTRVSGTSADGVWQGSVAVPEGTHPGDWQIIRVNLSWGCGAQNRVELTGPPLTSLGLPLRLHVKAAAAAHQADAGARIAPRARRTLRARTVESMASGWAALC